MTIDQWVAIMQTELGLDLDWRTIQPLLGGAVGRADPNTQKVVHVRVSAGISMRDTMFPCVLFGQEEYSDLVWRVLCTPKSSNIQSSA